MIYAIGNDRLTVSASTLGAQLWSIRSLDGTEYLWQGDPVYWGDRALTLFPYVARLWQGQYEMDGEIHRLPIHGFAPASEFALAEKTDTRMVLVLESSEKTYAQYPRRFVFRVIYALEGNVLKVAYEVENWDERTMYFGLGGHPGFNVPLEKGLRFEDYRLRFGTACVPVRVGFSEDCFVNGEDASFPLDDGCVLPLAHSLFDNDAIVLRDMAREVTLEAPGRLRRVTVSFPDMPYLGIWHRPRTDAPYVCIEPWRSLPARRGEMAVLEEQENLVRLECGKRYTNRWQIAIHEA